MCGSRSADYRCCWAAPRCTTGTTPTIDTRATTLISRRGSTGSWGRIAVLPLNRKHWGSTDRILGDTSRCCCGRLSRAGSRVGSGQLASTGESAFPVGDVVEARVYSPRAEIKGALVLACRPGFGTHTHRQSADKRPVAPYGGEVRDDSFESSDETAHACFGWIGRPSQSPCSAPGRVRTQACNAASISSSEARGVRRRRFCRIIRTARSPSSSAVRIFCFAEDDTGTIVPRQTRSLRPTKFVLVRYGVIGSSSGFDGLTVGS